MDGRKFVDGKIEVEQSPPQMWEATFKTSITNNLKNKCTNGAFGEKSSQKCSKFLLFCCEQ